MILRRLPGFFLLLTLMLLLPGWHTAPAVRATGAAQTTPATTSPFNTTTNTLAATVQLGTQQQVSLTITNTDSSTHPLRLYEAWSDPPVGATTRRAIPAALRAVALPDQAERIDTQISRDLENASDGQIEFLVFLEDQADLSAAYRIPDWSARGQFVVDTLKNHAEQSQHSLRTWLDERGLTYHPFWIVNAIAVEGNEADVQALTGRAEVALLRANRITRLEETVNPSEQHVPVANRPARLTQPQAAPAACDPDSSGICWNIRKIGAERVWSEFGVTGEGITVSSIDSGVRYDHPALLPRYRGYGEGGTVDHRYNWFDPQNPAATPFDAGNHGTHTMGTMVGNGDGTANQPAVGVAPGAHWIAARGCQTTSCTEADLMAAAEWLLNPTDPDGNNPRPDLRPQVINNSWADSTGGNNKYAGYTTAWRAAGIFPVFAAGNENNTFCSTVASPGDYANVVGVGAISKEDRIAYFSSIGPALDGRLKPDITAPGQSVVSTFANSGLSYGTLQGTSMAAPHVAATVALLWSANPTLIGDYDATYAILTESAVPQTDTNFIAEKYAACKADVAPNNIYGYGRLDAYAAVAEATVDVPWVSLTESAPEIAPGESTEITVMLDAGRVPEPGNYQARLLVHTNDLSRSPLIVAVDLTVTGVDQNATIAGSLHDATTGNPLAGTVTVQDGPTVSVNSTGNFTFTLVARSEPYYLTASAPGYLSKELAITAEAGTVNTPVFTLEADLPRLQVSTAPVTATLRFSETAEFNVVLQNNGTQALNYTLEVPSEQYGVWRSDEADGPPATWIDLPADTASSVTLADNASSSALPLGFEFPFYGQLRTQIYLNANGFLTFLEPATRPEFTHTCLPVPEAAYTSAIVPLRTDLDPAQGGTIRYATVTEGFVVTFEDVPLHDDATRRFTFQVVLTRAGEIQFNYKQLSTLPQTVAVGVYKNSRNIQKIGCGQTTPVTSGLTIELRPQPNAQFWIELPVQTGSISPGAQAEIPILLQWTVPTQPLPYRSAVVLRSNDPYQAQVRLPVQITTQAAPYQYVLPILGR